MPRHIGQTTQLENFCFWTFDTVSLSQDVYTDGGCPNGKMRMRSTRELFKMLVLKANQRHEIVVSCRWLI